jgi:HEAT repeat protein
MANLSEKLLRALESDDSGQLDQIIKEGKEEDFAALQSLLSLDPAINPEHRRKAIYALGKWGDPSVVSAINRLLPHLAEAERATAVDALGRLGTPEALAGVLTCAADPSPHVRKFVAHALGKIATPEAQAKLKEIEAGDSVDFVRNAASTYLRSGGQ